MSTCIDCRKCTKVCPAWLPVHAMARMESVECTSGQDCVAMCPIRDCLAVRPARQAATRLVRPALAVGLAAGICLGVTVASGVSAHWRRAVSEGEYARWLQEIDLLLYTHVGGMASAGTRPGSAPLVQSHGPR